MPRSCGYWRVSSGVVVLPLPGMRNPTGWLMAPKALPRQVMVATIKVQYMDAGSGFWMPTQSDIVWDPRTVLRVELARPEVNRTGGGIRPATEQLNETSDKAFWSSGNGVEPVGDPVTWNGKVSPATNPA